ncbi:uncharacterized protein [Nothobranchius furzeri]|uniref:uncharacterized protein n=1 Tax=Nothobranchius furzeri TaxID=105023 RepID=UPI003904A5A5
MSTAIKVAIALSISFALLESRGDTEEEVQSRGPLTQLPLLAISQLLRVGPGCRHQLVCREQDGVSLLLPENRRAKDLGRKLVFFWRPLRCFCFNHTRRVSVEERTIEALKNGTQAVISDGEIKTLYKDLCSGRVKSGLMYLWHNPGVSLKLKQRLKPLMFHFADAQVDELTERIGSCSGIDKLIKKREFQFLDLVFDILVPEVRGRV